MVRIPTIKSKQKYFVTWYKAPSIPMVEETKHTTLYVSVLNSSMILTAKSSFLPVWWQQNVWMVGSDIFPFILDSKRR